METSAITHEGATPFAVAADVEAEGHDVEHVVSLVPTFKPMTEKTKEGEITDSNGNVDEENDDENEFNSRPTKIFRFGIGVVKQVRSGNEEEKQISKTTLSKQELRAELFKVLKKLLKAAFTIIVKKKKLSPQEAFETNKVLGVTVPKFIHPSSLEYVEEVAKKLILFLHRNSSEGCAMHIMIEKNKTLHVVQRFVFRTVGSLDPPPNILNNNDCEDIPNIDIEEFKAQCRICLLKLLNSDTIKPMIVPTLSRWSISIGLKPELLAEGEVEELWRNDPSGNYFPWKKRPKNLANIDKSENNNPALKVSSALPTNCCNGPTNLEQQKCEEETTGDKVGSSKLNVNKENAACNDKETLQLNGSSRESSMHRNDSAVHHDNPDDEASKIVCFPLSSFPVTANLTFSIYGLEYPAPINAIVHQSSAFSPRIVRSQSHYSRISHFKSRHRLLRQPSNKI